MGKIVTIDEQVFKNIADAIRGKIKTTKTYKPGEMAAAIGDIKTGGGTIGSVYQDQDGYVVLDDEPGADTVIESLSVTTNGTYTAPTGTAYSPVTVNVSGGGGDEPDPTDGKTHIWIHIDPNTPANRLTFPLYFGQSVANGVTVDWGDGSATETFAGTSATVHNHTYATGGDYEITLEATNGTLNLTGTSGSSGYTIYGSKSTTNSYNRSRIRRVHIGDGVTSIGVYCFYYCYALKKVSGMGDVTTIDTAAFYYCYSLSSITIPSSVTVIRNNAFYNCYSLSSITISSGVTVIGNTAFSSCYGMAEYHLLPTTPPTLGNSGVFSGIPSDCIIYVPYSEDHSILEAYKTATNWSTYANYMQEESQ